MLSDTYVAQRTLPVRLRPPDHGAHSYVLAEDRRLPLAQARRAFHRVGRPGLCPGGPRLRRSASTGDPASIKKVTARELVLTYPDGCEHGIELALHRPRTRSACAGRGARTGLAAHVQRRHLAARGCRPIVNAGLPVVSAAHRPGALRPTPPQARSAASCASSSTSPSGGSRAMHSRLADRRTRRCSSNYWRPQWLRWHVGYETLAPAERRAGNGYRGLSVLTSAAALVALSTPTIVGSGGQAPGDSGRSTCKSGRREPLAVARPRACSATLLRRARPAAPGCDRQPPQLPRHPRRVRPGPPLQGALRRGACGSRSAPPCSRAATFSSRTAPRSRPSTRPRPRISTSSRPTSREIAEERAREAAAERRVGARPGRRGRRRRSSTRAPRATSSTRPTRSTSSSTPTQFSFGYALSGPSIGFSPGAMAHAASGQGYEDVFRLQKFEYEAKVSARPRARYVSSSSPARSPRSRQLIADQDSSTRAIPRALRGRPAALPLGARDERKSLVPASGHLPRAARERHYSRPLAGPGSPSALSSSRSTIALTWYGSTTTLCRSAPSVS